MKIVWIRRIFCSYRWILIFSFKLRLFVHDNLFSNSVKYDWGIIVFANSFSAYSINFKGSIILHV